MHSPVSRTAGEAETLEYHNASGATEIIYLAVDAFRPPDPSSPDPELEGQFSLTVLGVVPTAKQSLGGLKHLYR